MAAIWCHRKLRALNYPGWNTFDITNISHVHALVAWLEDCKIRCYPVTDRTPLRTFNEEWDVVLRKYLQDVEFPHKIGNTIDWTVVVNGLLAHAIALEYEDNVDKYNAQAKQQGEAQQTKKIPIDTTDYNSAQFKVALLTLSHTIHIPMHEDLVTLLNAIRKAVKDHLSHVGLASQKENQTGERALHMDTSISEEKFPLGFNTGESSLNKASTIFRLLYIKDLRELQTEINNLIVAVQAFTANPKTNTALGKVGR